MAKLKFIFWSKEEILEKFYEGIIPIFKISMPSLVELGI